MCIFGGDGVNRIKRILLGLTVMALCIGLFAGSDPDVIQTSAATADRGQSDSSQTDDSGRGEQTTTSSASERTPDQTTVTTVSTKQTASVTTINKADALIKIELGSCILFADNNNYIILKDENDLTAESVTVEPDDGSGAVTVVCKNGMVAFERGGEQIKSFTYKGKTLQLKDGGVFWGEKKLQYTDMSFNRFDLSEDVIVVLSARGNYTLRTKEGKFLDSVQLTDDNGKEVLFMPSDDGTELIARDEKGTRLEEVKIGGNNLLLSDEMVLVNGKLLQRAHSEDIMTSITTSAPETETETETETSQTSEPDQSSGSTTTTQQGQTVTTTASTTAPNNNTTAATTRTTTKATTTTKAAETTKQGGNIVHATVAPLKIPNHYTSIEDKTAEFLAILNPARKAKGLAPLSANDTISQAAKIRAEEYAAYPDLKHMRPTERGGGKYHTVFNDVVYKGRTGIPSYAVASSLYKSAENLANGYGTGSPATAKDVYNKWYTSALHNPHMFDSAFKHMAVYKVTQQETINGVSVTRYYWVQIFYSDLGSWAI